MTRIAKRLILPAVLAGAFLPGLAPAAEPDVITTTDSSPWKISATVYAWAPKIIGTTYIPLTGTTSTATLSQSDILNHLNMTGMGSVDVHYRDFGLFTDVIYIHLGGSKTHYHNFEVDGQPVPASTDTYLNLSLKSTIATYAAEFRFADTPLVTMDVLAGARYFWLKTELGYVITGRVGNLPPATRTGSPSVSKNRTDAIGGFKGAFHVAPNWDIPAYLDIGGDQTWQAATGVGYKFRWGEVSALYRYLNYYVGNGGAGSLTIQGPMIGATLHW